MENPVTRLEIVLTFFEDTVGRETVLEEHVPHVAKLISEGYVEGALSDGEGRVGYWITRSEGAPVNPASTAVPRRLKCTDPCRNVAYIHHTAHRGWSCTLANGIPAAMHYAVGNADEMALKFRLEDAASDAERLQIVREVAGPRYKVELV